MILNNKKIIMINRLLRNLPIIGKDKLLHFFYGTISGFFFVLAFGWVGILIVSLVAILKEAIDYIRADAFKITFIYTESIKDIAYTVAPSILFFLFKILN
jgi:hypothetical protein